MCGYLRLVISVQPVRQSTRNSRAIAQSTIIPGLRLIIVKFVRIQVRWQSGARVLKRQSKSTTPPLPPKKKRKTRKKSWRRKRKREKKRKKKLRINTE
ncbi:hypothetical protein BO70DRAFT_218434 [Aspergillus heteromorphus CBS 117.55]|uniref:Uncharacterized protein n=1 Tax=Aspergillus heteromorphus CBS 117.55 TaxID=1448321 RepID=A0A317WKZ3_9EURO|nr:uncharacterized protein BO70DRAFT_218434 [Aspergillus heteromorphus CBS 117.55]PWY85972.1 hypothetical protein BO70DRAFT_218434 [Aspergillus heteromorphus CBS 117.55]